MSKTNPKLVFNTAIITYPSDYDGLLTLQLIIEKFESIINDTTKIVVAREDPDDEIQRIHYHLYWDDDKRKQVNTSYFDITLPEPVIVFIKPNGNRDYRLYSDIASQLGIDNLDEMRPKLDHYLLNDEKENYNQWEYLSVAHPNIQLKQQYGDKYFMLRYVLKQKLLQELPSCNKTIESNFNYNEELRFLEENCTQLLKDVEELTEKELLKEINVESVHELVVLLKRYKKRKDNKKKKQINGSHRSVSVKEFGEKLTNFFFMLLILLMIAICYNDIFALVTKKF